MITNLLNQGKPVKILNYPDYETLIERSFTGSLYFKKWNYSEFDTFITPTDKFFIRNHLNIPKLDKCQLSLSGLFRKPAILTQWDLYNFKETHRVVTIECNGNRLKPAKGLSQRAGVLSRLPWYRVFLSYRKLLRLLSPIEWANLYTMLRPKKVHAGTLWGIIFIPLDCIPQY